MDDNNITLKEYFEKIISEHDKAVQIAFSSQEKAITALKEFFISVHAASEKAIVKAEEAQRSYNSVNNDLSRKMEDQYKIMMPRTEATSFIKSLEEKIVSYKNYNDEKFENTNSKILTINTDLQRQITDLALSRGVHQGQTNQIEKLKVTERWAIGIGIAIAGSVIGIIQLILHIK